MFIQESNTVINDAWRGLLIITSDTPIPNYPNNVVVDTQEYYETTYYTDGVFRSFEEDGKFINQYLINSKVVAEREIPQLNQRVVQLETQLAQQQSAFESGVDSIV